ncbi:MAG: helix-turn-helix transcriptional regulator [Bacillota bacterium]
MNRFSPERLRRALDESEMTQARLARKMGISRASLSRVLRGLRSPGSKFIAALKTAFPDKQMESFFDLDDGRLPQ